MTLSEESELFIGNLRAYLNVSGKDEKDIEEIVNELEVHLIEAEADGKNIEDIIGQSPEQYMQSIRSEMNTNIKGAFQMFFVIIFGGLSISVMPEVMTGTLSYSLFVIAGLLTEFTLFTIALIFVLRKLSQANLTTRRAIFIITPMFIVSIALLVGIFYFDSTVQSPTITLSGVPVYIIGMILFAFLIGVSIWAKSWIILLVVFVISIPDLVGRIFSLSIETTSIIFLTVISIFNICLIIYFIRQYKKDKDS